MTRRWISLVPSPISRIFDVPVETGDGGLLHEAGPAEDLGRRPGRRDRRLGGVELGHRRLLAERLTRVLAPGGLVGQGAGVLDRHREVGQCEGDRLEPADRPSEGVPLLGVVERVVEARLCATDRKRSDRDPAVVEDREEVLVARARLAQERVAGDGQSSSDEVVGVAGVPAELVRRRCDGEARCTGGDDERGDLVVGRPGGDRDRAR